MANLVSVLPMNQPAGVPDLLTVEQMCDLLKVDGQTVRRWCRTGQLPAMHIGRRWYVPRAKLNEFLGVS